MPTLNDYRRREHHSFSSINQFVNICSLQYAFQRIYKVPKAFTPISLVFGGIFHRVMEWVSLTRKENAVKANEASALFIDLWQRDLKDVEDVKMDGGAKPSDYAQQGADLVACEGFCPKQYGCLLPVIPLPAVRIAGFPEKRV